MIINIFLIRLGEELFPLGNISLDECQVFLEKEGVLQKSDIESIGVTLIPAGSVDQSHLFRLDDDWTGFHEKTPKNESKTSKRKSVHIDSIMEMLDWENPLAVQEEGIRLAERVENFNVFIQPCNKRFHKNVWDNCAKIISSKTDEELLPYLSKLFMWLQDLNWPRALTICERLLKYKDHATFDMAFDSCMKCARAMNDSAWEENLLILEDFDQYFPNRKPH